MASVMLHAALAVWTDRDIVMATAVYSGFIVWVGFMVITYWVSKVWQAWSILGGIILLSTMAICFGR
ncbi:hypothetical protein ABS764_07270 [Flavobacterium sp. ST-87]|uniref:Small Multidrug Resistance protein n=1 Tax=Flavobacterium plantiphilum TaxID=3163297 RepID=A0ABW8XSC0_9FLAO